MFRFRHTALSGSALLAVALLIPGAAAAQAEKAAQASSGICGFDDKGLLLAPTNPDFGLMTTRLRSPLGADFAVLLQDLLPQGVTPASTSGTGITDTQVILEAASSVTRGIATVGWLLPSGGGLLNLGLQFDGPIDATSKQAQPFGLDGLADQATFGPKLGWFMIKLEKPVLDLLIEWVNDEGNNKYFVCPNCAGRRDLLNEGLEKQQEEGTRSRLAAREALCGARYEESGSESLRTAKGLSTNQEKTLAGINDDIAAEIKRVYEALTDDGRVALMKKLAKNKRLDIGFTASARYGKPSFKYRESITAEEIEERRSFWEVGFGVEKTLGSDAAVAIDYRYQSSYKFAEEPVQLCTSLDWTAEQQVAFKCEDAQIGAPPLQLRSLASAELRKQISKNLGLKVKLTYDLRSDAVAIDMPIYFLKKKTPAGTTQPLLGGVRLGFNSETDSVVLAMFIGGAFELTTLGE